jgi:hypothetical protein
MKSSKSSNHSVSNSQNKHIFSKNHLFSSNISTTQRASESNKNVKVSSKNILEMIYDDEFVIMINQLSTAIKNYYRANNKNFLTIKSLIKGNDSQILLETFNKIESTFSLFYSSAKQIFKNMKIYRREKISNIMAQNKKKNNIRNNNINPTVKQRNSDIRLKQLIKGETDMSTNNILNNNKTLSINITQQNINNNINSSVNISNIMINTNNQSNLGKANNPNDSGFSPIYDNGNNNNNISEFVIDNAEEATNSNTNTNNFDEYFDVIKKIGKKNIGKSSKVINEYKEENNKDKQLKRGNSVNSSSSMIINSLNKNESSANNKQKTKKFTNMSSSQISQISLIQNASNNNNNNNNNRIRMTSTEKNLQNSFELKKYKNNEQISINDILINDSMIGNEDFNNIIKDKENIIINLKRNKVHLENQIKELEKNNNDLHEKIENAEKSIKEKEAQLIEIKNEKEKLDIDNNNYKKKIEEILNEKNDIEFMSNEDKNKIKILDDELSELKKNYNELNTEKSVLNDKYNLLNEDNYNLKKENKNIINEKIMLIKKKNK